MAKRRFGETAEDYDTRRGDDDEIWIKGFRNKDTTIRILQPTREWVTYREHYNQDAKAFHPCTEDSDCIGCNSEDERTRKRTRKYVANALDSEGRLNVYKFGSRMFRTLKGREERSGNITSRDYTIMKSGQGMDTTYDIEAGDKYEIDDIPDLVDIWPLLEAAYDRAVKLIEAGADDDGDDDAEDEPPARPIQRVAKKVAEPEDDDDTPPPPKPAAKKAAAKKVAAKKVAEPEPEPEPEPETTLDFEEMSTKEIKAWLDEQGVEYPDTAPRSKIIALAKEYVPF